MSQAPVMPVFTDALLGDTLHLSAEEFGAYCLLLFATWRNNGMALADDDRKMARICRVTVRRWQQRLRPVLVRFFRTDDHFWHQKRLEKEWQFVAQSAAISRANGSKGGRPKLLNGNDTQNPAGCVEKTQNITPHTHTHIHKKEKKDSLSENGKGRLPDPADEMTRIWNVEAFGQGILPNANRPSPTRRATCQRRWRENFGSDDEAWRLYCRRVGAAPFLRGENDRGWRADLDWVLKPENLAHIMEGRYDARQVNGHGHKRSPAENLFAGFAAAAGFDSIPDRPADEPLLDGGRSARDSPGSGRGLD